MLLCHILARVWLADSLNQMLGQARHFAVRPARLATPPVLIIYVHRMATHVGNKENQTCGHRSPSAEIKMFLSLNLPLPLPTCPPGWSKPWPCTTALCIHESGCLKNLCRPRRALRQHTPEMEISPLLSGRFFEACFEEPTFEVSFGRNSSTSCPLIILRWFPISGHWSNRLIFS